MASKVIMTGLVLVLVTMFSTGAMAQSNCTTTLLTMASCLNYVQGTSPTPPSSCCSALATVVQTNPRCLCQVLDGGAQFGITINTTRALSLPAACRVKTPPVSKCHDALAPAPDPSAFSPSETGISPPEQSAFSPSGTGADATPGNDTSASNVADNEMHLQVVGFLVLFLASSYV